MRIEPRRESGDCGIVALSRYLGRSYEDVLRAVVKTDRSEGKRGLHTATIVAVARRLGCRLVKRRGPDLSEVYGILLTDDHATVIRNGLVFEPNATVWDLDTWLHVEGYSQARIEGVLVAP